ncbi:6-phosphogluconolactonase [Geotalea sp. SG265]|uniref:6-phosphogluconolactonase n=1 Tax=Geotalea sp. SG265 TaxID=2922867 RepID=UPI001FB0342C|nr:6-phosphogluconolactonase [Geotalea sp. SG265]
MMKICSDLEDLSQTAAEVFAAEARRAVKTSGRFTVALAGGSTPRRTYEILSHPPYGKMVPWQETHVFWGDERCVSEMDPRNNARMADQALLAHVSLPREQVHPMVCDRSPHEAAEKYEKVLRTTFGEELPRFDLILLGLGENGHTASLFPETPVLKEQLRWVTEVYITEEGLHRLTLTLPVINRARTVLFLVSGAGKAGIIREIHEGSPDPYSIPAALIRPDGRLLWLIDSDAGQLLRKK